MSPVLFCKMAAISSVVFLFCFFGLILTIFRYLLLWYVVQTLKCIYKCIHIYINPCVYSEFFKIHMIRYETLRSYSLKWVFVLWTGKEAHSKHSVLFSVPVGPVMEDWDIISPKDVIGSEQLFVERTKSLASAALPFTQSLLSQVHSAACHSLHWLLYCYNRNKLYSEYTAGHSEYDKSLLVFCCLGLNNNSPATGGLCYRKQQLAPRCHRWHEQQYLWAEHLGVSITE